MYKLLIIIISVIIMSGSLAFAAAELPVRCTGDSVTYNREENIIYGKGNVEISYKDNYLRADNVTVNLKTKEIEAEGRVVVSDGENIFTGSKVYYNLDTGKGEVDGIGSTLSPWFAFGEHGQRVSEELYCIKNGYVTTCDYEKPHYRIKAKDIYIYPEDKIVAKHIVFYWGNVPLFYWPYFSKSLKDKRSPWTVIPGQSAKLGKFLLLGYSMWWENFLGGTFEPTLRLDWYEKRGIGTGVYAKYRYKDKIMALIRSYFIDDKGYEPQEDVSEHKKRGRFSLEWVQRITDRTRGIMKLNYLSDPDIVYDFFRNDFQDEIQTENYINISHTTSLYQLTGMLRKRINDFYTVTEQLPEVAFSFLEHRIGKTRLFYEGRASAGYFNKLFASPFTSETINIASKIDNDYSSFIFDTRHQLRYPKKYFGWLNFIPRIGTRQTYFNKSAEFETKGTGQWETDEAGNRIEEITRQVKKEVDKEKLRSVYFTGAEFTTKISKVFYVDNNFWQVNQLRHVIEPRINYIFQHEPTVSQDELLDLIGEEAKQNFFALGLRNKLQTKRNGEAWDLVDLWIGSDYHPEMIEENDEERSFSHIRAYMEFDPFDWLSVDMDADFDQYDKEIDSFNTQMALYKGDKLSFALGYRYSLGNDKLWTSEVNYTINSDWAFRMIHRFDFNTGELQKQEYILFKDMHCWNLAVTFREYRQIDEKEFFVAFYPKAYPDIPITFGSTFFGVNDTAEVNFGGQEFEVDYGDWGSEE